MKIEFEEHVRLAAFEKIRSCQQVHGEVLPLDVLQQPVRVENLDIPRIAHMRGIHKPSKLRAALAVLTVAPKKGAPAPYDDCFDVHGSFRYHYRDPGTEGDRARLMADSDNRSLRVAMDH